MNSLSFDGLVSLYDETRCVDPVCFQNAIGYLSERFPAADFPKLFEPGIGTGRIAAPMAQKGYEITGVDISSEMLWALRSTCALHRLDRSIQFAQADVTDLPFGPGGFDLAVVVHLFYFIHAWRKAAEEILRVIRAGGAVILMHTGMGMEIPGLNERYKNLCLEQGYEIKTIGAGSTREVIEYYQTLGCRVEWVRGMWGWVSRIEIVKALGYLQRRAYSFTVTVPEEVHQRAIERMKIELGDEIRKEAEVPNEIYMAIIRKERGLPAWSLSPKRE